MTLCAAVIGCGNISCFHFSGLEKAGVNIKWVVDIVKDNAIPWCRRYNAQYSPDYMTALNDPAVNFVVITAPSKFHKEIVLAAIEKKKAIICEKTLAENAADSYEMVSTAQKAGVILYTSYMKRFIPAISQAKELLPSIGQIGSTYIRSYQPWGDIWGDLKKDSFFYTPENETSQIVKNYGGGILACGGSHLIDLILFLLGKPVKLYANMTTLAGRDYDLQTNALFETEKNGTVHFEAFAHPLKHVGFLRDGWDEKIEITGLRGKLKIYSSMWDQVDQKASLLKHYDNQSGKQIEYRYAPVSPFDLSTAFFVDNIRNESQGSQSVNTGYKVDEIIEHINKSSTMGQTVVLQWKYSRQSN